MVGNHWGRGDFLGSNNGGKTSDQGKAHGETVQIIEAEGISYGQTMAGESQTMGKHCGKTVLFKLYAQIV